MKDKLLAFVTILSIGGLSSTVGVAAFWYTDGLVGDSWASMPMMLISPIVVILFFYACFVYAHMNTKRAARSLALMLGIYASGFVIPLVLISFGVSEFGFRSWVFPVLICTSFAEIVVIVWATLTANKKAGRIRSKAQLHR